MRQDLEILLDHSFQRKELLEQALAHPGRNLIPQAMHYERLEFLGDRVLGICIANLLFHHFPHEKEGELARRYACLCSRETLIKIAQDWQISEVFHLLGFKTLSANILADTVEALLGAIYLDAGIESVLKVVQRFWQDMLSSQPNPTDAKSALQYWAQAKGFPLPQYVLKKKEGPEHAPRFVVEVSLHDDRAEGTGESKKVAEHRAALTLLTRLKK